MLTSNLTLRYLEWNILWWKVVEKLAPVSYFIQSKQFLFHLNFNKKYFFLSYTKKQANKQKTKTKLQRKS